MKAKEFRNEAKLGIDYDLLYISVYIVCTLFYCKCPKSSCGAQDFHKTPNGLK